jgi:hypothetical protein
LSSPKETWMTCKSSWRLWMLFDHYCW